MPKIAVSEARKKLSELLKRVSDDPDKVYEITVNDIVLGELRASSSKTLRVNAGDALLKAMDQLESEIVTARGKHKVARSHNDYLYPAER